MQTQMEQILQRTNECIAKAKALFGVDMKVMVRFDLKGRSAGQAGCKVSRLTGEASGLYIRYNRDMLTREAFDHVLNNTVPHEVAHLACYVNRRLGKNHDAGWERVCVALGGSGATRHSEEVVYGKGNTYEYTTTLGHKVRMGDRHHNAVQRGIALNYRNNKGSVNQFCAYSIVGMKGRTLAQPIVKHAPNHPAIVEMIMHEVKQTLPAQAPAPVQAAPQQPLQRVAAQPSTAGLKPGSKAAQARQIMAEGKLAGTDYETIIARMMSLIGYDRQLARGTFKANAARVGITI